MLQKNTNRVFTGILLLSVLEAPQLTKADIVFSNLTNLSDANNALVVVGATDDPGILEAESFESSGTYTMTDAEVLVNYGLGPDNLNVFLYSDSNGLPGTEIEQIAFDLAVSSSGGIVTADSLATPLTLTAGSTYWLVLAPASSDTFINWLNGGSSAPLAASSIGGAPFVSDGDFSAQFQIDGDPVTSTVPEPSSLWLVGAVTGLFCVMNRLKSRRVAMIS